MGIFSRTRDIIAANVTDLLDKAEDPAKMIRMIIMEMEETLVEVRASAARTIADQKEMRRQIVRLETVQASWLEKAELALSKDREDLVSVDDLAGVVDREAPVGVPVEREADVGAVLEDGLLQDLDVGRAAAVVDVGAVGLGTDRHHLGTAAGGLDGKCAGAAARIQDARAAQIRRQPVEQDAAHPVAAGAHPASVSIVDVEEVPLAYLPGNATRIRIKAVGDLSLGGSDA